MGQVSFLEDLQSRLVDSLHDYFWPKYSNDEIDRIPETEFRKVVHRITGQAFQKFEKYDERSVDVVAAFIEQDEQIKEMRQSLISAENSNRELKKQLEDFEIQKRQTQNKLSNTQKQNTQLRSELDKYKKSWHLGQSWVQFDEEMKAGGVARLKR
ncbi:MAG: hypothetical protein VYC38_07620 [Pseudomonadota bacterium]|nr:hypothetical protein [Pseudomonadota bacterium]